MALGILPPSAREGDREAVVGVSKVLQKILHDFIIEGRDGEAIPPMIEL